MIKNKTLLNLLNIFIFFIIVYFSIPLVLGEISSVDVDDIFKFNESINYAKPCFNNGTYCSSSTNCNLTVTYPNNSVYLSNVVMTNRLYVYNYSFLTNTIGVHKSDMICSDQGNLGSESFYFIVTRTGNILTTGESILYIIFLIASFTVFLLTLFGAIKVPYKNPRRPDGSIIHVSDIKYFKIFLISILYMELMFIFGILRSILSNYLFLSTAYQFFDWLFWLMFAFMTPIGIVALLFTFAVWIQGQKLRYAIERGLPTR